LHKNQTVKALKGERAWQAERLHLYEKTGETTMDVAQFKKLGASSTERRSLSER